MLPKHRDTPQTQGGQTLVGTGLKHGALSLAWIRRRVRGRLGGVVVAFGSVRFKWHFQLVNLNGNGQKGMAERKDMLDKRRRRKEARGSREALLLLLLCSFVCNKHVAQTVAGCLLYASHTRTHTNIRAHTHTHRNVQYLCVYFICMPVEQVCAFQKLISAQTNSHTHTHRQRYTTTMALRHTHTHSYTNSYTPSRTLAASAKADKIC